MQYLILLARAIYLFLFGWIADFFARRLDKLLEGRLHKKKPLSSKMLTAYARFCETLFKKWQKCETNYLLFQTRLGTLHSHNNL